MVSIWPFRKRATLEKRASGFTAAVMEARADFIVGRRGLGELTATVQSCIGLWENGFALAQVKGTDLLKPQTLAMIGRALAVRGEAVFWISDERLVPASDWDLSTRDGAAVAYRLSISEAGGGRSVTALAGEVLHFRIGADLATPWAGSSPLRRSSLTAGLLHTLESALAEIYEGAPLGSQIVPFPESSQTDIERLQRGFRGRRGSVLLRESVNVTAAGGPTPQTDWRPNDLTPDLARAGFTDSLASARNAICGAYGILPALFNPLTTGPLVREAQRHLAAWVLQPICELIAEEASEKFGSPVELDCISPLQAFDQGGRARALATYIDALASAKAANLSPTELTAALAFIDEGAPHTE